MHHAPIALFVYNRPCHTRQTVEALQKNELAAESDLVIFSDGEKSAHSSQVIARSLNLIPDSFQLSAKNLTPNTYRLPAKSVQLVREYIRTITGFKSVRIVEREKNLGLANSIISGVTEIINQYGRIIVIEDDMVTSPYFLRYMNEALDLYANEENVFAIHGYLPPLQSVMPETFFLKGADCWGWATWEHAWRHLNIGGSDLMRRLISNHLMDRLDFGGILNYSEMLKRQINGEDDSWAVLWHASVLLEGGYSLHPGKSLVRNIGNDSSGSHEGTTNIYDANMSPDPIIVTRNPILEEDWIYQEFRLFARKIRPGGIKSLIIKGKNALRRLSLKCFFQSA